MEGPKGPGPHPFATLGSLPVPVRLGRRRVSPAVQPRYAPPYNRGKTRRHRTGATAQAPDVVVQAAAPTHPLPCPHTPPLHDRSSTGTLAPVNGDTQQQHQQHLSHNGRAPHTRSRKMRSAGRGRRRKAPSISPSSAPPLPAVLHAHHAALRRAQLRRCATGAAVGLRQGPAPPHRSAGERSAPRCGGSSRANPTLPQRPPAPASRADRTHSRPPSRSAGRS